MYYNTQILFSKPPVVVGGGNNIPFPNTSGTFTQSVEGSGFKWGVGPGYATSNLSFAANAVGWIQMEYTGTTNQDAILGVDLDNNNLITYDAGFDAGVLVRASNSNLSYVATSSIVGAGVVAVAGTLMRINRDVSMVITADYSTNAGASWTTMINYGAYAGQLWVKSHILSATHYLLNPLYSGLT